MSHDVPMRPGKHGGMLRNGSRKGNSPGTGRVPSAVREACRLAFDKRLPILTAIADGWVCRKRKVDGKVVKTVEPASVKEQLDAINMLGKYGGLQRVEYSGADGGPVEFALLPGKPDAFDQLMARLARAAEGEPVARVLADGSVPATPEPELPPGGNGPAGAPKP